LLLDPDFRIKWIWGLKVKTRRAATSTIAFMFLLFSGCSSPSDPEGGDVGEQVVGSIVGWGSQIAVEPSVLKDLVAITGGDFHSIGLKSDGAIVAWGHNYWGQCELPAPNADFVAVAGGGYHSLGLKSDGTIVAWGNNDDGQCDVPAPNADFVAVAGGG